MALFFNPFSDAELVLCGTEQSRLLFGVLKALEVFQYGLFRIYIPQKLTSYRTSRTLPCREADAVSDLLNCVPKALGRARRPKCGEADNKLLAGRAKDRANTILLTCDLQRSSRKRDSQAQAQAQGLERWKYSLYCIHRASRLICSLDLVSLRHA